MQITSQEVEAFGGDVNSIIVDEPQFLMSSLSPGRNYSISIQSVSNGVESDEVTVFQATRKYCCAFGSFGIGVEAPPYKAL